MPLMDEVPEDVDPGSDFVTDVDLSAGRYVMAAGVQRCDWVIRLRGPGITIESMSE